MQPSNASGTTIGQIPPVGVVGVNTGLWNVWTCNSGEIVNGIATVHTNGAPYWQSTWAVLCCK